jgi:hypothetical protein
LKKSYLFVMKNSKTTFLYFLWQAEKKAKELKD